MPEATMEAPGYTATRDGDILTIHAVPIFCACERGELVFDEAWIAKAVAHAMEQQRGNYFPPLHIRHHEPSTDMNDSVRPAGYFKILRASPIFLKGKRRSAIMADLVITNPAVAWEIESMQLLYRSVEIFDFTVPSIDSLALLDHEPPFLELPVLMVSEVKDGESEPVAGATFRVPWSGKTLDNSSPVVACFRRGTSAHLLFRQETFTMPKTKELPATKKKTATKLFASDNDDEREKGEDMQEEGGDAMAKVDDVAKLIESGMIPIAGLDKLLAAIQSQKGSTDEPDEPDDQLAPAQVPGGESMSKADTSLLEMFAELKAEVAGLKANNVTRDKDGVREKEVAAAMKLLEDKPLGANLETELLTFHKDFGPKPFKVYVTKLAKTVGSVPMEEGEGDALIPGPGAAPDEAMLFHESGPENVDLAAKAAKEWEGLKAYTKMTKEAYVRTHMQRVHGITLKKKAS